MLEILRSKMMMGFAVIFLGLIFINTTSTTKLEEKEEEAKENYVAMNIQ